MTLNPFPLCPPLVPTYKQDMMEEERDYVGCGGRDVCDPPSPKKVCLHSHTNSSSKIMSTVVHAPNIPKNTSKDVILNDVCNFHSINVANVKTTCRSFPLPHTITSRSQTVRGDRSTRFLVQNGQFTLPSLKEKGGETFGMGNHFNSGRAIERSLGIKSQRSIFSADGWQQATPYHETISPPQATRYHETFSPPQATPYHETISPPPNSETVSSLRTADESYNKKVSLTAPLLSSGGLATPPWTVNDPYSYEVFPTASLPPNSGPATPLRTANKPCTSATRALGHTLKMTAGSSVHVKIRHVISPSRSKMAATRLIHKYIHKMPCVIAAPLSLSNPLGRCLSNWKACKPNEWILRTITHGYRLQFARRPPLTSEVIYTPARGRSLATLREEVRTLLDKGAIQKVNLQKSPAGFYSKYFLVEKRGGAMRPILDLRGLNKYLKKFTFKMLTTAALLSRIRRGTWFCTVDLKDAFFHISIYPPHRKFLRFGLDGQVYQYTVLPFGMSLSPRVFTKCTHAAIAPLRARGIRLDTYLDDWLISAESREEAARHTDAVVSHLSSLGFVLNLEKSTLVPSQQTTFLGIRLDSTTLSARLSQDRIDNFLACARTLRLGDVVPYNTCLRVSGFMASAIHLVRLGRFYMRPFQRWMLSLRVSSSMGHQPVRVTQGCIRAIEPWLRAGFLSRGVRMGLILSLKFITTDASRLGWGAIHNGMTAKGVWSDVLRTKHINYLELLAVFLALKRFEPFVRGCHVHVRTDNTATMCYVNKQGGLASPALDRLARSLTLWCDSRLKSIRASHVPGLQNTGADLLSRGRYYYDDWSLHPKVVRQIFGRYGRPDVDLFASEKNAKCARFFSIKGVAPLGLEAFAHDWPKELLYAFPPLQLIRLVLERIRLQGLSVLLVAPGWGTWRSEITPLLYDHPWRLPPLRDLVSQADGGILHPRPAELDLWAWPVRGRTWLPAD